jgi:hypothetical protein
VILWPSIADERELAMRHRFANVRAITSGTQTPWQRSSAWIALLFFGLTLFAVAATFGFFALIGLPQGWITAAICIGVAEVLIQERRMFGTGIESALWIGGLFAFLFGFESHGDPEAFLAFAAAAGVAGLRMRNPYFGTFSALLVVIYLAVAAHGQSFWSGGAVLLAVTLTICAAAGLLRTWSRPSTDSLLVSIVIVMPVAAYISGKVLTTTMALDTQVAILFAALAVLLLALGLTRHNHALVIAGLVTAACVAIDVHALFLSSDEARLMVGGTLLLIVTAAISRVLRGRTRGVVATPTAMSQLEQAIQLGGSVAIAHPQPGSSSQPAEVKPGGGDFGGAGASGGF